MNAITGLSRRQLLVTMTAAGATFALGPAADIHINVREVSTARVQEVHRTIIHAICSIIEPAIPTD